MDNQYGHFIGMMRRGARYGLSGNQNLMADPEFRDARNQARAERHTQRVAQAPIIPLVRLKELIFTTVGHRLRIVMMLATLLAARVADILRTHTINHCLVVNRVT